MDSVEMLSLMRSYYVCWLCTEAAELVRTMLIDWQVTSDNIKLS